MPVAAAANRPLHEWSERDVDDYLKWLNRAEPDLRRRVVDLGRRSIGQPYRLHLLGEGGREPYDPDPLFCLSASDCVTFVEQTCAMALADGWDSFHDTLQRIRYKDGRIAFAARNHFTEADWNVHNAWLFEDITASLPGATEMSTRVDRAAFFRKHGLKLAVPVQVCRGHYLPRGRLSEALILLRDADVAEVVRGDGRWQYVSHMGLIVRDDAGVAMLLHATEPAVRMEPLAEYVARNAKIIGMKFLRPRLPIERGQSIGARGAE